MKFQQLRYLVAVHENGLNIPAAARQLLGWLEVSQLRIRNREVGAVAAARSAAQSQAANVGSIEKEKKAGVGTGRGCRRCGPIPSTPGDYRSGVGKKLYSEAHQQV